MELFSGSKSRRLAETPCAEMSGIAAVRLVPGSPALVDLEGQVVTAAKADVVVKAKEDAAMERLEKTAVRVQ